MNVSKFIRNILNISAISAGCIPLAFGFTCIKSPGRVDCGSGVIQDLQENGTVRLSNTIVKGIAQVNGSMQATKAEINKLDINGSVDLSSCLVNESVNVKGLLNAKETKIEGSVHIYSNRANFSNTTVKGDIVVKHIENQPNRVYLDKSSVINGNIVFEDGDGEVVLSSNSRVIGQIIGGTSVKK